MERTITLTFGDCAENHVGMQKIGNIQDRGLSTADLDEICKYFESLGYKPERIRLNDYLPEGIEASTAEVVIIPSGVNAFVSSDDLMADVESLDFDTKAFMYGRVVNKKARYNICFSDFDQEPNYEEKKGRVVSFEKLPLLSCIRKKLGRILKTNKEKLADLQCEGNYYYDTKKTYIGFHGDAERRIVVAVRLGYSFNLYYRWFKNSEAIGREFCQALNHGDVYFMSDKAVGYDWKKKTIYTLRHASANDRTLI